MFSSFLDLNYRDEEGVDYFVHEEQKFASLLRSQARSKSVVG